MTQELQENDKENSSDQINQSVPTINPAKLQLEKSISKSIFPDAPTTPKVSRKTLYDDEDDINTQVKEIVKKYQLNESQQSSVVVVAPCCEETNKCLICKPDSTSQKVEKSSELNKEITC